MSDKIIAVDLTADELSDVAQILQRRANEVAEFHRKYRENIHFGSVEMALSREVDRLRDLAARLEEAAESKS